MKIKIQHSFLVLLFILLLTSSLFTIYPRTINAGGVVGGLPKQIRLSASKTSLPADGQTVSTVTAFTYWYQCANGEARPTQMECDGANGGVVGEYPMSGMQVDFSATNNAKLSVTQGTTGSDGKVTTNVTSTSVGTSTVTGTQPSSGTTSSSVALSFTVPSAAASQSTPTISKTKTTTAAPTPPASPTIGTITIDNKALSTGQAVKAWEDKPLVISGKTVANGVVTLYIFSDPKTATATADKDGNWSSAITGLSPGDHHIEAEVKDTSTNLTSARAQLLAFTVRPKAKLPVTETARTAKQNFFLDWWLPIAAGIAMLGLGASYWWFKYRRPAKKSKSSLPQMPENNDMSSPNPTTKS